MTIENIENNGNAEKKPENRESNRWYKYYLIVFTFLFAVTAYYFWTELNNAKYELQRFSDETNISTVASEKTISNLEKTISKLSKEQELLAEKLSSLNQQQEPLDNEDWALAEVEYLLVIATHHLVLEQDINTALAAMDAASQRLEDLGNTQLDPLKEQLEKDINKLREVKTTDIPGLANYLADLIERSEALPLKKTVISQQPDGSRELKREDTGWKNLPGLLWKELKELVVIKRNDNRSQPLLLPQEEYFLYQNLRLELENGRLAVLLADNDNFQASITMLTRWLNKYFDTSTTEVSSMLESLEQMKSVDLGPELPDISSSLESLRAYSRSSENLQYEEDITAGEPVL